MPKLDPALPQICRDLGDKLGLKFIDEAERVLSLVDDPRAQLTISHYGAETALMFYYTLALRASRDDLSPEAFVAGLIPLYLKSLRDIHKAEREAREARAAER